ncbi:MAG: hypothetical protein WBZ36_02215 [Candidatus Nitrosopolaris sp.]
MKPSISKIRSNYRFLLALLLGVTIIMSVLLVSCNNVNAKTFESVTEYRKSLGESPQIMVGKNPADIITSRVTNKIYVANADDNTVSVIDSDSGNTKTIRVGLSPQSIAIDDVMDKIYVANTDLILSL